MSENGGTASNSNNNQSNHHRSYSSNSNHARGSPLSPSPPLSSFANSFSPKRHMSPRHSSSGGGGGGGAGSGVSCLSSAAAAVAAAAVAAAAPPPPPANSRTPPNHHHHLRERGALRTRFDDEEGEEDEEARAARAARGRRNRPRSVSMPEGMELQARVSLFGDGQEGVVCVAGRCLGWGFCDCCVFLGGWLCCRTTTALRVLSLPPGPPWRPATTEAVTERFQPVVGVLSCQMFKVLDHWKGPSPRRPR